MKPSNSFIDESFMKPEGEPIEYNMPSASDNGLVVKYASEDEWLLALAEYYSGDKE